MGGTLSQLPLADSTESTIGSDRISTSTLKLLRNSDDSRRGDPLAGTKSEQSLAPSEHALFSAWNRRSSSAGNHEVARRASRTSGVARNIADKKGKPSSRNEELDEGLSEQTVKNCTRPPLAKRASRRDLPPAETSAKDDGLIYQIRAELFRELATAGGTGTVDNKELALGLDNRLIKDVLHELRLTRQPISRAVPRLLQILQQKASIPSTSPPMTGFLHIRDPKRQDGSIFALHVLSLLAFAESHSQTHTAALVRIQTETAVRDGAHDVDFVVDFTGLMESALRINGAVLIRRVIADMAGRRDCCKRVFFVDFPEDYRLHCARWRNELPRDFRRRIWCVNSENLHHVLPDYACLRDQRHRVPSVVPTAPSSRSDVKTAVSRSKSTLSHLQGIVETSSCNLAFKQLDNLGTSESEFTIRNVNRSSFVVCRFLPKRSVYTIVPTCTFLLPYPKRQLVTIQTKNNVPVQGDIIRLQVYVLNPEDGHQIPVANGMRTFMGDLKHEVVLKRGCDLVVSSIIRATDGHQSEGNTSGCDIFEQTAEPIADWDDGTESSYDWTKDSVDSRGDPLCAPTSTVIEPVAESTQTNVLLTGMAAIQTDMVESPGRRPGVSSEEVQTDEETAPPRKTATELRVARSDPVHTISDSMQTDDLGRQLFASETQTRQMDYWSEDTQTEPVPARPGEMQTDFEIVVQPPLKIVRSAAGQTDDASLPQLKLVRSAADQAHPIELNPVFSGSMQTEKIPVPLPKAVRSASGQTQQMELKSVSSSSMQTDPDVRPLPKPVRSASGQTQPVEVKSVSSGFMQTDEAPTPVVKEVMSASGQTPHVELMSGVMQTDSEHTRPVPRATRSEAIQTDTALRNTLSGFMQTDTVPLRATKSASGQTTAPPSVQAGFMQTDVALRRSEFGQTNPAPIKAVQSGVMQTDTIRQAEMRTEFGQTDPVPVKSVQSGVVQTEAALKAKVKSQLGQTDPIPMRPVISGVMQTDKADLKSEFGQTDPVPVRAVHSGIVQTDELRAPPKAVHSAFGQTESQPVRPGFMQTDSMPNIIQPLPKVLKTSAGQTDEEIKPLPRSVQSSAGQTDEEVRPLPKSVLTQMAQTDPKHGEVVSTQTASPPAAVLGETQTDVKQAVSGIMQTDRFESLPAVDLRSYVSGMNQTDMSPMRETAVGDLSLHDFMTGASQTEPTKLSTGTNQTEQVPGKLVTTQTDFKEKSLVIPVTDAKSAFMQTEPGETAVGYHNTQTDPVKAGVIEVQTDFVLCPADTAIGEPQQTTAAADEASPMRSHLFSAARSTSASPPTEQPAAVNEPLFTWPDLGIRDYLTSLIDTVRNVDMNPLWILAAVLALALLAHWLELHKVVSESTWVADWKYKDGVSVGGRGLSSANTESGGASWFGGETQTRQKNSMERSGSGALTGGSVSDDRRSSQIRPPVSAGSSGTLFSAGGGAEGEGSVEKSFSSHPPKQQSTSWFGVGSGSTGQQQETVSGSSWFSGGAGNGGRPVSHSPEPAPSEDRTAGTMSSATRRSLAMGRDHRTTPSNQLDQPADRSSTASSSWFGGQSPSTAESMKISEQVLPESKSWFGSRRSVSYSDAGEPVHFVRDGSLDSESGGFFSYGSRKKAPPQYEALQDSTMKENVLDQTNNIYPQDSSSRVLISKQSEKSATRSEWIAPKHPFPVPYAATGESSSVIAPVAVPGFEASYRSAFWSSGGPGFTSHTSDVIDDFQSPGETDGLRYSVAADSYRGISGPAYSDHSAVEFSNTPRSLLANFLFGASAPIQVEGKPGLKQTTYELVEFHPDMTGALPILRGLELTTPEVGLTKQWLHNWPFRFDPGKRECWDRLRTNPNYLNFCKVPPGPPKAPLLKKKCVDQFFSLEHYMSCRISHLYDHSRWGV